MTFFIFAGDMFVMGFMIVLVVWLTIRSSDSEMDAIARIPLEDDENDNG